MTGMAKPFGVMALGIVLVLVTAVTSRAQEADGSIETRDDGEGIDSQLLWPNPGPSNFPTVLSSDVVGHKDVTFAGLFNYYRKPLGVKSDDTGETEWVVEDAFTADFLWAFGIMDIFQIGLALPVVLNQDGVGAMLFKPQGVDDTDYALASSALRDLRFNGKARFLGGGAEIPDRRDFGLALDLGLTVPTGDELNFAGDEGVVFFPTAIVDFHRCKLSAAVNIGARFRFSESENLADLDVGHQGTFGLGATGHYFDRRLLLSLEGMGLIEFDGFDRVGFEYRGGIGYIPDEARSITLWLTGGSSAGTGDLLGTPLLRMMIGVTYAPKAEDETPDTL
ncbi:MAG: hypothetical protein GY847_34220 [Proteobacteria bacterium]|nr:hypothetical protein [Pseudomonadota bacterium]